MAKLKLWAGFHECMDVAALHARAGALKSATDVAQAAGCTHEIVLEDTGDQQIAVSGTVEAVATAASEYAEWGFDPEVSAASERELKTLEALLPEEIGVELEA